MKVYENTGGCIHTEPTIVRTRQKQDFASLLNAIRTCSICHTRDHFPLTIISSLLTDCFYYTTSEDLTRSGIEPQRRRSYNDLRYSCKTAPNM